MKKAIPQIVDHLKSEYRRFLKTSYRFLDSLLRDQFDAYIDKADIVVKGPLVTLSRDFLQGKTLSQLISEGKVLDDLAKIQWPFKDNPLYRHQERALETGRAEKPFVVTTGTGSGKTEAFLLPVFDGILRRKRARVKGVQAIFIYPMNALANDQLERLRRLLRGSGVDISFGLYTGNSDAAIRNLAEEPAETERQTRAQIRRDPPDILLTNYKQMEFLLVREEDRALFSSSLRYLVLDELHSYRGALATEIACLIRRLKSSAQIPRGSLIGIGTSATVASDSEGATRLADFVSDLFGERFEPAQVIGEELAPLPPSVGLATPPPPTLTDEDLIALDCEDESKILALFEKLVGEKAVGEGSLPNRIAASLKGNSVPRALEDLFSQPQSIETAATLLREKVTERASSPLEEIKREIEAYLLLGSIGDEGNPPRLRPKLHLFLHGVYDVWLCINPRCRRLLFQGTDECPHCHSAARAAALCRTCGQDFLKVRVSDDNQTEGTADFYSDERTAYLTHKIHELAGNDTDEEGGDDSTPKRPQARRTSAEEKLDQTHVCLTCGRLTEGLLCTNCNQKSEPYLIHHGKLNTCPSCRDIYIRREIVSPLRTGTASTMSTIMTHHLDSLEGGDRKLLVFADNRQDAAHQAGYTSDKHRSFALRHVIAQKVLAAGADGIHLSELPEMVFEEFKIIGVIEGRPARPQRVNWVNALTFEVANEFTRFTRQRISLENLGIVAVDYEFLDEVARVSTFLQAAQIAKLSPQIAICLTRAFLDFMRARRAVDFDFFQRYVDPSKLPFRVWESEYGVRFPSKDKWPKAFALDRPQSLRGIITGFIQENERVGNLAATQKLTSRILGGDRHAAEAFIRSVVSVLKKYELLKEVQRFPFPRAEGSQIKPLQINHKFIRLNRVEKGFRCNACQTRRAYDFPGCPNPRCREGRLIETPLDQENYYVRLYQLPPKRLVVKEHSAQIEDAERAKRETEFKGGKLDALVCTPTLELGVDIGPLLTVALRNAPPTPANYIQRVARVGRRLRIGFVSTFCAGGAHDRHTFENPEWMVSGKFTPPRIRLDNHCVVRRHLRSFVLAALSNQLPVIMKEFLDSDREPTRWKPEILEPIVNELSVKGNDLSRQMEALFTKDRSDGKTRHYGPEECKIVVQSFEKDLKDSLDLWWYRVKQLDDEFKKFSAIGAPTKDERKARARKRAFTEITSDPERAYVLNYLSTQGLFPAYQFPIDTFSLDPGVHDTPTLHRSAAIAIEEFAPGNFVYANGHKLQSIRVLYSGSPAVMGASRERTDAESSGRLLAYSFCGNCDEVAEDQRNDCPRCGKSMGPVTECIYVKAFEAEEALRIGSDEESRQRQFHLRKENLISRTTGKSLLFPYTFSPLEYSRHSEILITNWGKSDGKNSDGQKFFICRDCGRHQPGDPNNAAASDAIQRWADNHARVCAGTPVPLVLAYKFQTDTLTMTVPSPDDVKTIGKTAGSSTLITLAEALLVGAADLLEVESHEIAAFPRKSRGDSSFEEIIFYETVPGGAGYIEEIAQRFPEVALAARKRLFGHDCVRGCYLCLKHFRNRRWHSFFNKNDVRDILVTMCNLEPVSGKEIDAGRGVAALKEDFSIRQKEFEGRAPRGGPQSPIEERLLEALKNIPELPLPVSQYKIRKATGEIVTIPDFAYPDARIAIFCDGYAFHSNPKTLDLDAKKRNWLQSKQGGNWIVLTYWGRAILRNPDMCAKEIADILKQRPTP